MLIGEATVRVRADSSAVGKELSQGIGQAADRTEKDLSKRFSAIGKKASIALTLPIVGGLIAAGKAAAEENRAVRALDTTLRRAAGATDAQVRSSERFVTTLQNATGIADDQLRPALGRLVSSTRNVTEAQRLLAIATDVSVARSISLEGVATALGRASQGQVAGLSRLGIATKDASGETKSFDAILRDLEKTFGGVAKEAADPIAKLQVRFGDVVEEVGGSVIPAMERLAGVVVFAGEAFSGLGESGQTLVVVGALSLAAVGPVFTLAGNVKKLSEALHLSSLAGTRFGASLGVLGRLGGVAAGAFLIGKAFVSVAEAIGRIGEKTPNIDRAVKALADGTADIAEAAARGNIDLVAIRRGFDEVSTSAERFGLSFARAAKESGRGGLDRSLDGIDKALAQLVQGGALDTARQRVEALARELNVTPTNLLLFLDDYGRAVDGAGARSATAGAAAEEGAEGFDELGGAAGDAVSPFDRLSASVERVSTAIDGVLSPTIDAQEASDRFQGAIHAVKEQLDELRGTTDTTGESQRRLRDALRDAERAAIAEVEALVRTGQIAPQAVPQALFDRINGLKGLFPGLSSEIDAVLAKLRGLSSLRFNNIQELRNSTFGSLADRFGARRPIAREHGGPVLPGNVYQVGEAGPELAVFPRAGQVIPNDVSAQILDALKGQGRGGNTTMHFAGSWPMDPREYARAVIRERDWANR